MIDWSKCNTSKHSAVKVLPEVATVHDQYEIKDSFDNQMFLE